MLKLVGSPNFRDIGGHQTKDGRFVRRGMVFRSGDSARLSDADIAALRELGIKLIIDMRSEKERLASASRWPVGPETEVIATNVRADLRADNQSLSQILHDDPTPNGAAHMTRVTYEILPDACGPSLEHLFRNLAGGTAPTLFHCTLGRDRTGLVAAVLQHVLGVPYPTIVSDYMLTNERLDAGATRKTAKEFLRVSYGFEASREMLDLVSLVQQQNFETGFKVIEEKYGTLKNYLAAFGVDADMIEAVRQRLLE
jgi:protein-tyrosine phosphatase